jgi:hypothetical protein
VRSERGIIIIIIIIIIINNQIKEDEMGGSCRRHGRDEKLYKIWSGNLKGRDHSEDRGADGKIILEWILGE